MALKISPLAPQSYADLAPIDGVRLATAEAGIRYKGRTDVLLAVFDQRTSVAGVFTKSRCPSAAVDWCRAKLAGGVARALVVNSGNANAFTGKKGKDAVKLTADIAAAAAGCKPKDVFLASTGVIGEPLDAHKFAGVLDKMAAGAEAGRWMDAAKAIMTTDTYPKLATRHAEIAGQTVTINGIAKGSGMIAPDMATMLSFIFTDAPIAAAPLQAMLSASVGASFNAVTVDSDTSTSDTVLAFATGAAARRGVPQIGRAGDRRLAGFKTALADLMQDLALQVVRDGEGATKLVTVSVKGAKSKTSAKRVALSIANSPLVKTAIAGCDANWGRVVMAVGKAGEPADRDKLAIWFGPHRVAHKGERDASYDEQKVSAYMTGDEITVSVDLNIGPGNASVWTCDLTHAYIDINGSYRS